MVVTATPGFAQAYCACYGTGTVIYTPLLEKTNAAYGYEMSVPPRGGGAQIGLRAKNNGQFGLRLFSRSGRFEPSHEA